MSEYIHKSHNVTVLLYHLVFPAKYRRAVFDPGVDEVLHQICLDLEQRYQVKFLEIGVDKLPRRKQRGISGNYLTATPQAAGY